MAVYIKPPKGNINLAKLHTFTKRRLLFLFFIRGKSALEIKYLIEQEKFLEDFDCLTEGCMKDRISHFVLRFLCSSDSEMQNFFIQSETDLFKYRLEFCSKDDLESLMFHVCKQSRKVLKHAGIIKSYRNVLEAFIHLVKDFELAILKKQSFLKVPFTYCLNFVKNRLHPLINGFVCVPLTELKQLLITFFEEFVSQGMLQTKSSACIQQLNDSRFSFMRNELKTWFKANVNVSTSISGISKVITEEQLNVESLKFPLCMKSIHFLLRKTHRLPHYARIQYILFLKEIGVPCQEVLNLFMKEYSFPVTCTSICNHSWEDSRKRYTYSIQHLFGEKGSGKNYRAHSCHSLQSCETTSVCEGGCPFSCYDGDNISKKLVSENLQVNDIEDIKCLSESKKYTEACSYFLNKRLQFLKQSTIDQKKDSSEVFESCKTKVYKVNNNQSLGNDIAKQKKKSCQNNVCTLSRPSEFYFMLSDFIN